MKALQAYRTAIYLWLTALGCVTPLNANNVAKSDGDYFSMWEGEVARALKMHKKSYELQLWRQYNAAKIHLQAKNWVEVERKLNEKNWKLLYKVDAHHEYCYLLSSNPCSDLGSLKHTLLLHIKVDKTNSVVDNLSVEIEIAPKVSYKKLVAHLGTVKKTVLGQFLRLSEVNKYIGRVGLIEAVTVEYGPRINRWLPLNRNGFSLDIKSEAGNLEGSLSKDISYYALSGLDPPFTNEQEVLEGFRARNVLLVNPINNKVFSYGGSSETYNRK